MLVRVRTQEREYPNADWRTISSVNLQSPDGKLLQFADDVAAMDAVAAHIAQTQTVRAFLMHEDTSGLLVTKTEAKRGTLVVTLAVSTKSDKSTRFVYEAQ